MESACERQLKECVETEWFYMYDVLLLVNNCKLDWYSCIVCKERRGDFAIV